MDQFISDYTRLSSADTRFNRCIPLVLKHEGGYVDHPNDPGGATNHGISLRYARTRGSLFDLDGDGDVDKSDILLVTPQFAAGVYREWFWRDVRGDDLPAGVDYMAFDFAVNSGPMRAIKCLQAAVGVEADGYIGPRTLAAVRGVNDRIRVITTMRDIRLRFLMGLKTWTDFGEGWGRRVREVTAKSMEFANL